MDTINTCARFLIIRLKLKRTEDQMIRELCELFDYPESRASTRNLMFRFKNNTRLMVILGSWMSSGPKETLTEENVIELFGQSSLATFAEKIGADINETVKALAEVIPVILKRSLEVDFPLENRSLDLSE